MATFKWIIQKEKLRADGTYNVKIQMIHKRVRRLIGTQVYVDAKRDVTRGLAIKNQKVLDVLEDMVRDCRRKCNEVDVNMMTADEVVELVTRAKPKRFDLDIIAYGWEQVRKVTEEGRQSTAHKYAIALRSLQRFLGQDGLSRDGLSRDGLGQVGLNRDGLSRDGLGQVGLSQDGLSRDGLSRDGLERVGLSVHELSSGLVTRWMEWIGQTVDTKKGKDGRAAMARYVGCLRTIHNRAKREFNDEDRGVVNIPYSPFARVVLPKVGLARPRALTLEQLRAMLALEPEPEYEGRVRMATIAREAFLLSFFLIGMNSVDMLGAERYEDGRVTYNRQKTRDRRLDGAEMSVRVEPEARELFERWRDPAGRRVFKFYRRYSSMVTFTRCLNVGLKEVGRRIGVEGLQFYAARHTWATLAANEAGVDKWTVHLALNHSDPQMKVTDYYIRRDWRVIDEANRKVMDLVFGKEGE